MLTRLGIHRGLSRRAASALLALLGVAVALGVTTPAQAEGRPDSEMFTGTVEQLPATAGFIGDWKVSGKLVRVDASTTIDQTAGAVKVGALVLVKATKQPDSSFKASLIVVKSSYTPFELRGTVEKLPTSTDLTGDWTVSGTTVHVDSTTKIDQSHGAAKVGAQVVVVGEKLGDGSVRAVVIVVKESEDHATITIFGEVKSLPSGGLIGDWVVFGAAPWASSRSDVTVHVSASTKIDESDGAAKVGAIVVVEGEKQTDGSINAVSIEVKKSGSDETVELTGEIKKLPASGLIGDWIVGRKGGAGMMASGRGDVLVHVVAATTIDETAGKAVVGALVLVKGTAVSESELNATAIVVKESGGHGDPSSSLFMVLHLKRTETAPAEAEGVVVTRTFTFADGTSREDLKVSVEGLLPKTTVDVIVDTIHAGAIMTDEEGSGHLFLSTENLGGSEPLPASLRPLTERKHIEVVASGVAVLVGDFADARQHGTEHPTVDYAAVALLRGPLATQMGVATAMVKGERQILWVSAAGLASKATFTLVADDAKVGDFTADDLGRLSLAFGKPAAAGELVLPDALVPVSGLLHIELLGGDGKIALEGDFLRITSSTGGVRRSVRH